MHAVSTQEEVFNEYSSDAELILFENTSKEIDLASSGERTVYSDTWTIHFAYKTTDDSIWFQGGTAPANEIRHQTLAQGDEFVVYLKNADLRAHEDIINYQNREYSAIVHNDKIYLVGGTDYSTSLYGDASFRNEIYGSTDGVNWRFTSLIENPWQGRKHHGLISYNNKLWLLGGYPFFTNDVNVQAFNDVWSTSDGVNWTSEISTAPWPASGNKVIVFNNKLWCINSVANWLGIYANEVWNSDNGKDWVLVNDSIEFAANSNFQTSVFNEKMWLIGGNSKGLDGYTHPSNSAWCSTDGINWELASSECLTDPIRPHSAFVYNDRLWLIEYTSQTMKICNTIDGVNWLIIE